MSEYFLLIILRILICLMRYPLANLHFLLHIAEFIFIFFYNAIISVRVRDKFHLFDNRSFDKNLDALHLALWNVKNNREWLLCRNQLIQSLNDCVIRHGADGIV